MRFPTPEFNTSFILQLQSLLYKFRSKHLQQHLHYVIENADSRALTQPKVTDSQGQASSSRGKDVRSTLYSRIGLAKETEQRKLKAFISILSHSYPRPLNAWCKIYSRVGQGYCIAWLVVSSVTLVPYFSSLIGYLKLT